MAKSNNIVHQYFKKQIDGITILVKLNPILLSGTEITILADGTTEFRDLEFDGDIVKDLKIDGFESASPLEFNIYLSGLL